MGILYMNTADVGDHSLWNSDGGLLYNTISTDYARTGSKSFKANGLGGELKASFANTQAGYGRVCYYSTGRSTYASAAIALHCGTTRHLGALFYFDLGTVELYMHMTLVATGNLSVGENEWGAYEFYWSIANSGGRFTLKENGTIIIDYTGDTNNDSLNYVNNMTLAAANSSPLLAAPDDVYVDDIIVRDDQWPYRGGIHVLIPNAGTAVEDWTPSAGNPEDCLDELPVTYDDYISTDATVAGTEQLVNLTTLGADVWNIRGVGVHVNNKSTVSTDAFVRTLLLPADGGASVEEGSDFGVESDTAWAKTFYHENPADDAVWEKADIDDLQIGVESRVPA